MVKISQILYLQVFERFFNETPENRTRDNLIKSQVMFTLFMQFILIFAGYLQAIN